MKVAYVTTYDASNIHFWSGLGFFMLKMLRDNGFDTETIGDLEENYWWLSRNKSRFYTRILRRNYLRHREPLVLKSYARQVRRSVLSTGCDVVFSPGTIPIAYLKCQKPIVFWTDATFAALINFYPEFSNLCWESIRNGHRMERTALRNCRFAIYASKWAADSAINSYDVDPAKVKIVRFGANIDRNPTVDEIRALVAGKNWSVLRLLFLGAVWERKGGDVAVEVAGKLNSSGLPTELHVVGCVPPTGQPDFVKIHGFVSKKDEQGRRLLDELFRNSHFLLVPTRAECFGVVFAEASSYGLPSIACDVGGTASAIQNDVNGRLFPIEADAQEYCDYILALAGSKEEYAALALSSFNQYQTTLNWKVVGEKVSALLREAAA